MLRKYTYIFALFSLLGFTAGCSDDLETGQAASNGKGLSLQIAIDNNEENTSSRTTLEGFDAKNNVQKVQIYVFEGTGDEATYLASEPVEWDEDAQKANRTQHTLKYASLRNGKEYTLLGVGMDDVFESTYTIESKDGGGLVVGQTTLEDAYAKLQNNASPKGCEFFTGTVSFEFRGENTNLESLTLRRRVAGVMLYVKDIPQNLYKDNDTPYRTTKVYVKLGRNQKKSVMLQRDFDAENWVEPEGEDLDDGKTLLTLDLSELEYKNGEDLYTIDHGEDSDLSPNTLYTSCYMLPLNQKANEKTLTVEIWGVENSDGEGKVDGKEENLLKSFTVQNKSENNATTFNIRSNYIYCIGEKAEGMDKPISLGDDVILLEVQDWIPIGYETDLGATRVQALFDDTKNEDEFGNPIIYNCINRTIGVTILPPSVLIRDKVKSIEVFTNTNPTYVLNETGQRVQITEDDKLSDEEENYYSHWLHIQMDAEQNKYDVTKTLTEEELGKLKEGNSLDITLFMNDYARPRRAWCWDQDADGKWTWAPVAKEIEWINDDIRDTEIVLVTKFEWDLNKDGSIDPETEIVTRSDKLCIRQYNTITVCYTGWNGDTAECGFSRYDVLDEDGDPVTNEWGFPNFYNNRIYIQMTEDDAYYAVGSRSNGAYNMLHIGASVTVNWTDNWETCAARVAQEVFKKVEYSGGGGVSTYNYVAESWTTDRDSRTDKCWYLPAQFELEGFMIMVANRSEGQVNTNIDDIMRYYWSSTVAGDGSTKTNTRAYAYCYGHNAEGNLTYIMSMDGDKEGFSRDDHNNVARIRQARQFSEYYNGELW